MFNPDKPYRLSDGKEVNYLYKNAILASGALGYLAIYFNGQHDVGIHFNLDGSFYGSTLDLKLQNLPEIKKTYTNFYSNGQTGPEACALEDAKKNKTSYVTVVFILEKVYLDNLLVSAEVLKP